jgi:pimeloyl-ACP methyl ester carboxylesterase
VSYSFVEESELKSRAVREVVALLRGARALVDAGKAAEFDSALEVIDVSGEGEEEEDDDEDWGSDDWEACDCAHCRGSILASTSYHPLIQPPGLGPSVKSGVEVVRLPLKALEDFDQAVPFITPRNNDHACTLICLHCLNVHTPWDGWEQYFAPADFKGYLRVVLVLADNVSWHDYPDSALLGAGGSSWVDILDMDSMDRSDHLLERLVDHEAALLNGHSERIVLMGMSQGGGQSMLRFLRSKLRLGGWVGSVCHVPTAPHTPRSRDPLVAEGRPGVNRDRPIRLLAGESDTVFPPGLVLRDAARLRNVGGFTNVEVEVRKNMAHEGLLEDPKPPKPTDTATLSRGSSKGVGLDEPLSLKAAFSGTRGTRKAENLAALHRQKSFLRAGRKVPELLHLQNYLPVMVDLTSSSNPEAC